MYTMSGKEHKKSYYTGEKHLVFFLFLSDILVAIDQPAQYLSKYEGLLLLLFIYLFFWDNLLFLEQTY